MAYTLPANIPGGINGYGMSGYWKVEEYTDTNWNSSNNASIVRVTLYVNKTAGSTTYGSNFGGYININGSRAQTWNGGVSVSLTKVVYDVPIIATVAAVIHNSDGSKNDVRIEADFGDYDTVNTSSWTSSYVDSYVNLSDYSRPPLTTATPTYDARVSGSSSITMHTSGTVPTGGNTAPAIDYFRWYISPNPGWVDGGGGWGYTDQAGDWTWGSFNTDTDYSIYAYSHNSEGFGPASSTTVMRAAPRFTGFSFPQGITGKAYSGIISGNNVSSYSVATGSLPPGLSISGSSIVGTPTTPGTYTFTLRATRTGVSTVDSTSQSIQIVAGGPWVKLSSAWLNKTVSNVSVTSNVATITTSEAHGITELNQPITISGVTGQTWLNADWIVTSIPTTTTFTVAAVRANLASTAISGSVTSVWKRSEIRIITVGGASPSYVQGYMLRNTGSGWNNTA